MREELARILDGITGSVRFSREDARWDSLLGCGGCVMGLSLSDPKMLDFADRMIVYNLKTGNFGTLVALTATVLDEAVRIARAIRATARDGSGRSSASTLPGTAPHPGASDGPNNNSGLADSFSGALAALRFTRLFAARMVATLGPEQLRAQVYARGKQQVPPDGTETPENGALAGSLASGAPDVYTREPRDSNAAITEGREEAEEEVSQRFSTGGRRQGNGDGSSSVTGGGGGGGNGCVSSGGEQHDVVLVILSALVSLCAEEEGALAEGFGDVQLEGVNLLLVLLGTQAYGAPPSLSSPPSQAGEALGKNIPDRDNVFLDTLLREAGTKRGCVWGVALPRAALGWFIRRPAAPRGSAASALSKVLQSALPIRRAPRRRYESTSTTSSSLSASALISGHEGGVRGSTTQRLLAAPGALVLFVARALLYVLTLRGLMAVMTGSSGGGQTRSAAAGRWVPSSGNGLDGYDASEVTEAPGGSAAEPGEWESNSPVTALGERASPLADRGVLLLLVLLHNRRSATPSAVNVFRDAVASCVDADLAEGRRPARASNGGMKVPSYSGVRGAKPTHGAGANGVGSRGARNKNDGDIGGKVAAVGSSSTMSSSLSSSSSPILHISFRGIFEAFAAALEAPEKPSRGGGGDGKKGMRGLEKDFESAGREAVALLLYSLLQANPGFLRAAVVRSDADSMLLPLLRTLHDCASLKPSSRPSSKSKRQLRKTVAESLNEDGVLSSSRPPQSPPAVLYVPAIVVLLFSQDAAFNRQAFRQLIQAEVPWYATRSMKGSSLGSLIVLCVLRCLGHNLSRLKDGYLLENCLAVLINLAPQTEHLQPYAAQRLVAVLISASRLWIEGASAAAEAAAGVEQARKSAVEAPGGVASGQGGAPGGALATVSEAVGTSGADGEEFEGGLSDVQELSGEVARVLLLFLWTCTRPRRLGGNVAILYAMLHDQVALEAIFNHPAIASAGWAADLPRLLSYFQKLAQKEESAHDGATFTVEAATEMIEKGVRHYTTEAMGQDASGEAVEEGWGAGSGGRAAGAMQDADEIFTLSYEEGENSEEFFLPYLWELVLTRTLDLNWNTRRIRIFAAAQQSVPLVLNNQAAMPISGVSAPSRQSGRSGTSNGTEGDDGRPHSLSLDTSASESHDGLNHHVSLEMRHTDGREAMAGDSNV